MILSLRLKRFTRGRKHLQSFTTRGVRSSSSTESKSAFVAILPSAERVAMAMPPRRILSPS